MDFNKRLQKNLLPPRFFIICAALMVILSFIPQLKFIWYPFNVIGVIFFFSGVIVSWWGSNKFRDEGTNVKTFNEPDKLVTDGLYKYSRNPMYLGFALALLGASIILGTITSFLVLIIFVLVTDRWYIKFEENALTKKFKERYIDYKKATRRWI